LQGPRRVPVLRATGWGGGSAGKKNEDVDKPRKGDTDFHALRKNASSRHAKRRTAVPA